MDAKRSKVEEEEDEAEDEAHEEEEGAEADAERETRVGMTEFAGGSGRDGREGVIAEARIKTTPEDFIVNEVDEEGRVVRLERALVPAAPAAASSSSSSSATDQPREQKTIESRVQALAVEMAGKLDIPPDDMEKITKVARLAEAKQGAKARETLSLSVESREVRQQLHEAIRATLSGLVLSKTENGAIIISGSNPQKAAQDVRRSRLGALAAAEGRTLVFAFQKRNMDSTHAISELAVRMGVHRKSIAFAGTKDKYGITTQLLSVRDGTKDNLLRAVSNADPETGRVAGPTQGSWFRISAATSQRHDGLKLGMSRGNHFRIALRDVVLASGPTPAAAEAEATETPEAKLTRMVERWTRVGFVNYFGLQRFGSGDVSTHDVGRAMLRRDWAGAVDLLLRPRASDDANSNRHRVAFAETRDPQKLLALPRRFVAEKTIATSMLRLGPNKPLDYMLRLPRHLCTMYLHAYQSWLWNVAVSARIAAFGAERAVAGDLVVAGRPPSSSSAAGAAAAAAPAPAPAPSTDESEYEAGDGSIRNVRVLTEEEAASGAFTARDVVIPLPGYDVTYPTTSVVNEKFFVDLVRKDMGDAAVGEGGLKALFRNDQQRAFSLPGGYRRMLLVPRNVDFRVVRYADALAPLVNADGNFVNAGVDPDASPTPTQTATTTATRTGLLLSFALPSGVYATMAIRELVRGGRLIEQQTKS